MPPNLFGPEGSAGPSMSKETAYKALLSRLIPNGSFNLALCVVKKNQSYMDVPVYHRGAISGLDWMDGLHISWQG